MNKQNILIGAMAVAIAAPGRHHLSATALYRAARHSSAK